MISVEVGADLGVNTTGALALLADAKVVAMHAVHVGRGTSKVRDIAFEIVHLRYFLYLF